MAFGSDEISELLAPLGFTTVGSSSEVVRISLPTNRPDIRRTSHGVADLIEEIARAYGYSKLPRRSPSWPSPGRPSDAQRQRTTLRNVLCGLGASEAWTTSLVAPGDLALLGRDEPEIVVTNPLTNDESRLRRSLLPGLIRSVGYNAERRQDDIAFFEIGNVFVHPEAGSGDRSARAGSAGGGQTALPVEPEHCTVVFARPNDDAAVAVAALSVAFEALGLRGFELDQTVTPAGFHPTRSAAVLDSTTHEVLGAVGEVDPSLVDVLAPGAGGRRVGALELDLSAMRDERLAHRKDAAAQLPSRFPSSDVDLAFVVADDVTAATLVHAICGAAGPLLEEGRLFDVYRGTGVAEGSRSLAVRIRLCADDRTLSDQELATARDAMISAAEHLGAVLR